jgi:NADPH-dependent curcumin reductase CurA
MNAAKRIVLKHRPDGNPLASDFQLIDVEIGDLQPGEILIRTQWLSLDPFIMIMLDPAMAGPHAGQPGQPMSGSVVGTVVQSASAKFAEGDLVEARANWATYSIVKDDAPKLRKVPNLSDSSNALGAAGLTGLTAYSGIINVAAVQAGETVVISAAAGAVGSIAGQIAKLRGAHVVGIAGGPDKCAALKDLGFDEAIDYRTAGFAEALKAAVPNGIDVYFENVGGPVTLAVLPLLKYGARMPMCGFISYYGRENESNGPDMLPEFYRWMMLKGLRIQAFEGSITAGPDAMSQLVEWVEDGRIKPLRRVYEGLAEAPRAFEAMFRANDHVGKTLVRI